MSSRAPAPAPAARRRAPRHSLRGLAGPGRAGVAVVASVLLAVIAFLTGARLEPRPSLPPATASFAVPEPVTGLDPIHAGGPASATHTITACVYEPLYQYAYLERPYVVAPCLAAGLPEVSDGGTIWRIRLRSDVQFQDDPCFRDGVGRALVADDVVASWTRLLDPDEASPAGAEFDDVLVGAREFRAARRAGRTATIDGIRATGTDRLELRLTAPYPGLLYRLADLATAVVPREAVDRYGPDLPQHPVGTGPFRVGSWRRGSWIVLERSPTFRDERYPSARASSAWPATMLADAGARLPLLDAVEFRFVRDPEAAWLMFRLGDLDLHGVPTRHFRDVVAPGRTALEVRTAHGVSVEAFPSRFCRWIGLDLRDPIVGRSPVLRRALSLALDRREFNEVFLGGRNSEPSSLVPAAFAEHDPTLRDPASARDLDAARRAREEAERAIGGPVPPLRIRIAGGAAVHRQLGALLVRWVAEAGLTLVPEFVEEGRLAESLARDPCPLFFGVGYAVDSPDVTDLLSRFVSGAPSNLFHYGNAEVDAAVRAARRLGPGPERTRLCRAAERRILADLPCLLLSDYNWVAVRHDRLRNFTPHAFLGPQGGLKYLRVEGPRRPMADGP